MAKKAFLYTGATFLLMMTILISANYLLLSKHTASESKTVNLEIDLVNNLISDARSVLFTNPNNTLADAMSDVAFFALNTSGERNPNLLAKILDPSDLKSAQLKTNVTKWFMNYTNMTLNFIKNNYLMKVTISEPVIISWSARAYSLGPPTSKLTKLDFFISFSYNLTINSTTYMNLTQTLSGNKTLFIAGPSSNGFGTIYDITVSDKSRIEFERYINCNNVYCVTCANPTCT